MFDLLVVATDGSESGERAVATALDLATRFDAAVHAVSVVDRGRVDELPDDAGASTRAALEERAARAADAVADRAAPDIEVSTVVREGRPADTIVEYAEEVDADAVALGTRGRGGEGGFLLGSVAESVVRTCECPVLTVRGTPIPADDGPAADA